MPHGCPVPRQQDPWLQTVASSESVDGESGGRRSPGSGAILITQLQCAHQLVRLISSMLRYGTAYVDAEQEAYERQYRDSMLE